MKTHATYAIAIFALAAVISLALFQPAQARVLDWVGMITNKSVVITETGFDTESIEVATNEQVLFYNRAGRSLRVVAKGVKLSTPPIPDDNSARLRFPRPGTYELFCDKPCEMSMQVIVTRN